MPSTCFFISVQRDELLFIAMHIKIISVQQRQLFFTFVEQIELFAMIMQCALHQWIADIHAREDQIAANNPPSAQFLGMEDDSTG